MTESKTSAYLTPAEIQWRGAQAYAPQFDDIYFAQDQRDEVRRVFIEPCGLFDNADPRTHLTIGELGFGTGLNLSVCAEYLAAAPDRHVHFLSFEAHPLRYRDWQHAAALHPNDPVYRALARHPLPLLPGWHRRRLLDGRLTLSVFHGDAAAGLAQLDALSRAPVDAWFLDGFAPDRNPDLWRPELWTRLAVCSTQGSRVATFTAAGAVRRGLAAVGFEMRRVDQRPHKRESLAGVFTLKGRSPLVPPRSVIVEGAGLAGATCARALADQGIEVTVCDPGGVAAGASGLPAIVQHGRLLADGSRVANLRAHAAHLAAAALDQSSPTGALQRLGPNLDQKKYDRLVAHYRGESEEQAWWFRALSATDSEALAGIPDVGPSLFFPRATRFDPGAWCQALLDHPSIETRRDPVDWAGLRVLCSAGATLAASEGEWLELTEISGQLDAVRAANLPDGPPIVGAGYFIPDGDGALIGATYEQRPWQPREATAHNLELNAQYLGDAIEHVARHRATRCVSSDRVSLIGKLSEDRWISSGHGSMGATMAPFAAEIIQSQLLGAMPPAEPDVLDAVNPQRFLARRAKRGPWPAKRR